MANHDVAVIEKYLILSAALTILCAQQYQIVVKKRFLGKRGFIYEESSPTNFALYAFATPVLIILVILAMIFLP